jgi:uncharacterized protein
MNLIELKHVLIDQRSEFVTSDTDLFPRLREPWLKEIIYASKLIKIVLGVRRSGKSTLCKKSVFSDTTAYVNFDDERLVGLDAKDLNSVFEVLNTIYPKVHCYFFDEIQNIDKWELFVSRLQRSGLNILISGSNGKLLGKDLATHLTGRQLSTILRPLIFSEFLSGKMPNFENVGTALLTTAMRSEFSKYFDDFFERGGFPEVLRGEPQKIYLRELFDKIVTRDIVQRFKVREAKILKEIALYLIQNSSQKVSFSNLKSIYNLKSGTTAEKYAGYLADAFLVDELRGYSFKLTERSTSPRKIYACDLGMMNALWSKPTIDLGAKLETLIFLELQAREVEMYYLAEKNLEVAFCIVEGGKPKTLIQVCYDMSSPKTRDRETKALVEMGEKYHVEDLQIVTMAEQSQVRCEGKVIKIWPAYQFCLSTSF